MRGGERRGQGAWIKANGAIQIVCGQHRSRSISATIRRCSVDGATSGIVDRRRVSVQWFSGTILTGLCGAALMGGAVYIALDGEANFAALPERVEAALRGTLTGSERVAQATRKTDKLPTSGETNAARQVIRISTTTRAGDREMVRVRPFVRVASNLSLTVSELSANVPKFNPARLLMDNGRGNAVAADETPGAEPDAEVSFVTRDLAGILPRAKIAAVVPRDGRRRARARRRGLDRQHPSRPITASLRRHDRQHRRRSAHGLCGRGRHRPLCGLRGAHRAGEHHAAAEERRQGQCAATPGTSARSR